VKLGVLDNKFCWILAVRMGSCASFKEIDLRFKDLRRRSEFWVVLLLLPPPPSSKLSISNALSPYWSQACSFVKINGKVKKKVDPLSFSDSTPTAPPISCTILLQIHKPNPEPWSAFTSPARICEKALNNFCWSSRVIPIPWSWTLNFTKGAVSSLWIVPYLPPSKSLFDLRLRSKNFTLNIISPGPSQNFMALLTKLLRTCLILKLSP